MAISVIKKNSPSIPRILIYGQPKIGKTTWASQAPNPIFVPTEHGLGKLEVDSFPVAQSFDEFINYLSDLYTEEHEFKSVIIDSADWLEPLVWNKVAKDQNKTNIEDIGYAKGYIYALDYWKKVMKALDMLANEKRMIPIIIGHAVVKTYNNPMTEPYDRYIMKLHDKARAVVEEWSDCILFAGEKIFTRKVDAKGGEKQKGAATVNRAVGGDSVLYTGYNPAFVAGNRFGLPPELPLEFNALVEALYG